jgi:hypothetical protein
MTPLVALSALAVAAFFVLAEDAAERLVMMPVQEIAMPESGRAGAPFEASFVGLLTNGCQRFERLEVAQTEHSATVVMWARERKEADTLCTADIRQVERTHTLRPAARGPFTITVTQPNNASTTREVRVE